MMRLMRAKFIHAGSVQTLYFRSETWFAARRIAVRLFHDESLFRSWESMVEVDETDMRPGDVVHTQVSDFVHRTEVISKPSVAYRVSRNVKPKKRAKR